MREAQGGSCSAGRLAQLSELQQGQMLSCSKAEALPLPKATRAVLQNPSRPYSYLRLAWGQRSLRTMR